MHIFAIRIFLGWPVGFFGWEHTRSDAAISVVLPRHTVASPHWVCIGLHLCHPNCSGMVASLVASLLPRRRECVPSLIPSPPNLTRTGADPVGRERECDGDGHQGDERSLPPRGGSARPGGGASAPPAPL